MFHFMVLAVILKHIERSIWIAVLLRTLIKVKAGHVPIEQIKIGFIYELYEIA